MSDSDGDEVWSGESAAENAPDLRPIENAALRSHGSWTKAVGLPALSVRPHLA